MVLTDVIDRLIADDYALGAEDRCRLAAARAAGDALACVNVIDDGLRAAHARWLDTCRALDVPGGP